MIKQILPIIICVVLIVILLIFLLKKKEKYQPIEEPSIADILSNMIGRQPDDVWIYEIFPEYSLTDLNEFRKSSTEAKRVVDKYIDRFSGMTSELLSNLIYFVGDPNPIFPIQNQIVNIGLDIINNIFNNIVQNSSKNIITPRADVVAINKTYLPPITITNADYWRPEIEANLGNINIFLVHQDYIPNLLNRVEIFIRNDVNQELEDNLLNLARYANGQFIGDFNNAQRMIRAKVILIKPNYTFRIPDFHPSIKLQYQYTPEDWMENTEKFQNFKSQGVGLLIRFTFSYINMFDANEGFDRFFRYAPQNQVQEVEMEEDEEEI